MRDAHKVSLKFPLILRSNYRNPHQKIVSSDVNEPIKYWNIYFLEKIQIFKTQMTRQAQ